MQLVVVSGVPSDLIPPVIPSTLKIQEDRAKIFSQIMFSSKMLRIIPDGKGKAKLIRNKRGGVRLKVIVDLSHTGSYCDKCWLNDNFAVEDNCIDTVCRDFERVTGTRKFWFEKDDRV